MKFRRPSHATVVAYLALFAAIGGSAYAASKVGTKDLKANAVTSPKIDGGAVRAGDVKAPVVRTERRMFSAGTVGARVEARCKKGERLLGGGGGWDSAGAEIQFVGPSEPRGQTRSYLAFGNTTVPNGLTARALCLRR